MTRSHKAFVLAGLLAAFGCNAILGTDLGSPGSDKAQDNDDDAGDDDDERVTDAGHRDASIDAGTLPPQCGDKSGLQANAPWPTGGACNTRISRAAVAPLVKPKIKWRYKVANAYSDAAFTSGPVIGADGTIYATFTGTIGDAGFGSELIAIKAGKIVFETPLPKYGFGMPTIGADGTIYVTTSSGVSAVTSKGVLTWTYPMAIGALVETSSPTVLADGTIVVAGTELVALHPNGTKRWSLASAWDSFTPSLAVTPSGMLVVSERSDQDLAGSISLVSATGKRGPKVSLDRGSYYTPLVSAGGLIVGASSEGAIAFDEKGTVKHKVAGSGPKPGQPFMAESAPFVWFGGAGAGNTLLGFNFEQGSMERTDLGNTDAMVAAGDGSLVSVRRSSPNDAVVGMDPHGAERWALELDQHAEWIWQPALDADGSVIVTDGRTLYFIAD